MASRGTVIRGWLEALGVVRGSRGTAGASRVFRVCMRG